MWNEQARRSTLFTVSVCSNCGTENPAGAKFCGGCGAALGRVCAGLRCRERARHALLQPVRGLAGGAGRSRPQAAPIAERRLVSVLFADLVGFTSVSESRDPEETRELLSRYFDTCRRLIACTAALSRSSSATP